MVPYLENTCVRLWISPTNMKQFFFLHFLPIQALPVFLIHSSGKKIAAFTILNNEIGLGRGKLWYNYINLLLTAVVYSSILFLFLNLLSPFILCSYSHFSSFTVFLLATLLQSYYHRMVWIGSDLEIIEFQPSCHAQRHLPLDQVALEPHPTRPWTLAGMGHPQPLWAICSSASPPSNEESLWTYLLNLSFCFRGMLMILFWKRSLITQLHLICFPVVLDLQNKDFFFLNNYWDKAQLISAWVL